MTQLFKNIFLLSTLFFGALLNASCPPNYTTASVTVNDGLGNPVIFSICYPSVVSLSVNSGQFNIYLSITNTGPVTSNGVAFRSFIPDLVGLNTLISSGCPPSVAGFSACDGIDLAGGGNGKGQIVYNTGLGAGVTTTMVSTVQATAAGTYVYQPVGIAQPNNARPTVTITVEAACPSITASNGAGATACSNGSATGNLYNFVTGGNSPYTFATAGAVGGSVSVNNAGVYSFTPTATGGSGSFNYQAFDIAGCSSNTGSISLPIVPSPVGGSDAFYTTTFGTPVVGTLNFTGGTAPYTITTTGITNGSVVYNSLTAQFTFTQTAPGASFFDYTVTDANGCVIDATPNIYIYSCSPGFTASAALINNAIYAFCAPSSALVGTTFQITLTIANPNVSGTTSTFTVQDLVPDPTQVAPPCPCDPGLLYLSNTGVPVGTTFATSPSFINRGGSGLFSINSSTLPAGTQYSLTMNVMATQVGPQTYTARVIFNPSVDLVISLDVLPCPTFTAANTGLSSCSNEVTGDLSSLVQGVSGVTGPYTFSQTGLATCGNVTVSSTGAFIYTAPIGFTGPCSFSYYATSAEGCASTDGTVTITSNLGPIAIGASVFICENSSLQGSLGASDGTPPYTFSIVTNGTLGTATITDATLGTFEYIPNQNTFGFDFFTFQVTDSAGCVSNIAQYNVGILEAPNATGVSFTACVNTPVSGNLNSFVSGGNPPYIFTNNGSFGGSVVIAFTGPYTFTPTTGFSGLGGFEYGITDSSLCFATGAVDINIGSPIIAPSGISLCTNITSSGTLAPQVTGGSAPYTFSQTGSAIGGIANVFGNGGYIFTPTPGFTGPASFGYQVVDSAGCLSTGSLQIQYAAPTANAGAASICENTSLIGGTLSATGGTPPYTFAIVTNGTFGTATITNATTGTFNYVPDPDSFGTDSFTFQVTDANGCVSNIATFTITINQSPITNVLAINDCINTPVVGGLAQQVVGPLPLIFSLTGTPFGGTASVDPIGNFTFIPTNGFTGPAGFVYEVIDGNGCNATGAVDITVSTPVVSPSGVNTCLNTPVSGDLTPLVTSGFPGYTFGFLAAAGGTASVSPTGLYNFVPFNGFSGPAGLVYSVTDSNGCLELGTVDISINSLAATNAPILSCEPSFSSNLNFFVTGGTGALTFTGPLSISCGQVSIAADGSFTYTAPSGFTGLCDFTYQVSDAQGCSSTGAISVAISDPIANSIAINDCTDTTTSGSLVPLVIGVPPFAFSLTGAALNGTATVLPNGNYTFTPSTGFTGQGGFVYEVVDNNACSSTGAVDVTIDAPVISPTAINTCLNTPISGDLASLVSEGFPPYTFALVNVSSGANATVSSTGIYNFVPTTGYSGPAGFIYSATDTNDCVNTGTVSVTVDSLAAGNGNLQTCNTSVSGILVDYVNGGIGALVFTGPLSSTCGTVTISPNGAFVYNAPTGFTGPCNFVYGVSDSIDCSSTGAITIVANTAPVVVDALIIPCANQSYSDTLAGLVQNNPPQPLTFAIVTQPTHGTLSNFNPATGAYTYTPQPGFIGLDSFQYQVTDAIGCVSNVGTITVDVVSCCPLTNDPVMQQILQQYWGFSGPTGVGQA
jgi:hypothetical protein